MPVSKSLQEAGFEDSHIRVIRVDDEPRWILSYAFNVGFRAAKYARILKADADIVLSGAFFDHNPLPNLDTFITGNWRTATHEQVHVNGFFYTSRRALARVGGSTSSSPLTAGTTTIFMPAWKLPALQDRTWGRTRFTTFPIPTRSEPVTAAMTCARPVT